MLSRPQREGQNRDGGGLIGAVGEYAGVADVEVGNVVGATEAISDKFLRIVTHAQGAGFVEAGAGNIDFAGTQVFTAARADKLLGRVFGVFPHQQGVPIPGKVKSGSGDAVDVVNSGIDIDIVFIAPLSGSLNVKTNGGWITALDFAFEVAAEAGDGVEIIREAGTAAVGVNGIAPDKFLFTRII